MFVLLRWRPSGSSDACARRAWCWNALHGCLIFAFCAQRARTRGPILRVWGLRLDIEEVIREKPALDGALCPLILDHNRKTRAREILERFCSNHRASSTGGARSRSNCVDGRVSLRTETSQQRARRAEADAHQANLQDQEIRCAVRTYAIR